jgi:hypothetical protein
MPLNFSTQSAPIVRVAVVALLATSLSGCRKAVSDAATATPPVSPTLAQDMVGTWVHVGRPGQVMEAPKIAPRLKFRTGDHWAVTQSDESGLVVQHFGGTYTLTNNEYVETQDFADETWLKDNGRSFKYLVKVEGDTMTQFGLDNPYTEVWKRVKADQSESQDKTQPIHQDHP